MSSNLRRDERLTDRGRQPVAVAVLGCGNVAEHYLPALRALPGVCVVGAFDMDVSRLREFAERHRVRGYASLPEMLCDDEVDVVVNLTSPSAHAATTRMALQCGKHVYSEKPLAATSGDAWELAYLARSRDLLLGVSPATWLGPAGRALRTHIASGAPGTVRLVYAHADHGRIERWHPRPDAVLAVGPVIDVGLYPLALMTLVHGPVRRVTAVGTRLLATRPTPTGPLSVDRDDFVTATLVLADGALAQLNCNFYVDASHPSRESVEFHGDEESLYLGSWAKADAPVWAVASDGSRRWAVHQGPLEPSMDWALGVADLVDALIGGRDTQTSPEHAAHLLEVAEAIDASSATGRSIDLHSGFPVPDLPGAGSTRQVPVTQPTPSESENGDRSGQAGRIKRAAIQGSRR
jgi:predicted dehydrogenase